MEHKTTPESKKKPSLNEILRNAGSKALGGGLSGAVATTIQVTSLMWLRTTMNYQYRNGTSLRVSLKTLYNDGGFFRFYRGYTAAMLQTPLSRFGDTAANAGILTLLDSLDSTRNLPISIKTGSASIAAGLFRIVLMPIDTVKTTLQVEGNKGWEVIRHKVNTRGPLAMFHGALGASSATMVGHFPWFYTFNVLNRILPQYDETLKKLSRNAAIGFTASCISDTTSNALRVVKTVRQTSKESLSYLDSARKVIAKDGLTGLFFRGLQTRILTNGIQGMVFTVAWRFLDEWHVKHTDH